MSAGMNAGMSAGVNVERNPSLRGPEIGRALRLVGGVRPREGFEHRLMARLENNAAAAAALPIRSRFRNALREFARPFFGGSFGAGRAGFAPKAALALLAAGLACAVVLVGKPGHNATIVPAGNVPRVLPGSAGFGSASAARLPREAIHPALSSHSTSVAHRSHRGRATERTGQGRAVLPASPTHKADGAVLPRSPYGAETADDTEASPNATPDSVQDPTATPTSPHR